MPSRCQWESNSPRSCDGVAVLFEFPLTFVLSPKGERIIWCVILFLSLAFALGQAFSYQTSTGPLGTGIDWRLAAAGSSSSCMNVGTIGPCRYLSINSPSASTNCSRQSR